MTFSRTSYSPIRRIDSNKRLLIITIACSALIDAVSARLQFQFLGQCANIKLPYMYIHTIEPTTNLTNPVARNLSLRIIKIINCARYCLANSGETYRLVGGTRTCVYTVWFQVLVGGPFLPFESYASLSLGRMRTERKPIQTADNEFSSTKRVSNNDLSWKVNGPSILLLLQTKLEHFSVYSSSNSSLIYRKTSSIFFFSRSIQINLKIST